MLLIVNSSVIHVHVALAVLRGMSSVVGVACFKMMAGAGISRQWRVVSSCSSPSVARPAAPSVVKLLQWNVLADGKCTNELADRTTIKHRGESDVHVYLLHSLSSRHY